MRQAWKVGRALFTVYLVLFVGATVTLAVQGLVEYPWHSEMPGLVTPKPVTIEGLNVAEFDRRLKEHMKAQREFDKQVDALAEKLAPLRLDERLPVDR